VDQYLKPDVSVTDQTQLAQSSRLYPVAPPVAAGVRTLPASTAARRTSRKTVRNPTRRPVFSLGCLRYWCAPEALQSGSAASPRWTGSTSTCTGAKPSDSSAPTAPGKSSTMRMIGCVSPPTQGELTIFGADPV